MNRTFPWLAVLSFALLLSACTPVRWFRADTRGKRDFSMDPRRTFQEVDFRDMLAAPQSYKGMDVKFTAMMNRRDENVWEPYYSSMSETEFYSFSIWTTDAEIWTEKGWLSSLPTVYARKDNPNLNDFFEVRRFEIAVIRATMWPGPAGRRRHEMRLERARSRMRRDSRERRWSDQPIDRPGCYWSGGSLCTSCL